MSEGFESVERASSRLGGGPSPRAAASEAAVLPCPGPLPPAWYPAPRPLRARRWRLFPRKVCAATALFPTLTDGRFTNTKT